MTSAGKSLLAGRFYRRLFPGEPCADRPAKRVDGLRVHAASLLGSGRHDHGAQAELRALLESALGLGGGTQATGKTDLPESGNACRDRRAARGRGDRQRDPEVGSGLVDISVVTFACDANL